MDLVFTKDQAKKDRTRFGGLVIEVYKRDNFSCVGCGMTMQQHLDKYRRRLTINHINGLGHNSERADNRVENLETVCLSCHGKRDCQNQKWQLSNGNPVLNTETAL